MSEVDPWLAGKAKLAEAKAGGRAKVAEAREAATERRRETREKAAERKRALRDERRVRRWSAVREAVGRWLPELPWLLIIGSPMALSWSAMMSFGVDLYGPVGVLLPAFADAALLVFTLARARAVRAGDPAGGLLLGVLVSASVAAGLAFAHGISDGDPLRAAVMAVVAVGGAMVHQLVHGRSPRTRRVRRVRPSAVERAAARRADRIRRAAVAAAVPVVRADGEVTLVHRSGPVRVTRSRWGRTRVVPAPDPAPGDRLADEIALWLAAGAPPRPDLPSGPADTRADPSLTSGGPDETTTPTAAAPADPAPHTASDSDGSDDETAIRRVLDAHAADGRRITVDGVRQLLRVRKNRASRIARAARDRLRRDDGGTGPVPVR
ncbi:hypothetical protein [Actinoalloteichus sp. GBA129-24]|uniref:hypothetical protein n=1 Tax=Actinoalloteichus sp. GBA129-24 TaxID=1612551 RepID=UPI000950A5F8|nr:hypothetical protein [Actinoalloteichus sp. GBA129-24]APU20133.1 hypothetical protein UA75_10600 [Actinoalloteichus sp. GBA129-24]